jgi:hypothetical protein
MRSRAAAAAWTRVRGARAAVALLTTTGNHDVHTLIAAYGPVDAF